MIWMSKFSELSDTYTISIDTSKAQFEVAALTIISFWIGVVFLQIFSV